MDLSEIGLAIDDIQIALRENGVPHSKSRVNKLEDIWSHIKKCKQDKTCESCKFKYVVDSMTTECRCNDSMVEYLDLDCYPDFGCNKWEENKNV